MDKPTSLAIDIVDLLPGDKSPAFSLEALQVATASVIVGISDTEDEMQEVVEQFAANLRKDAAKAWEHRHEWLKN